MVNIVDNRKLSPMIEQIIMFSVVDGRKLLV